jgi:FlaG/FlaF family flagellin (archaellin)
MLKGNYSSNAIQGGTHKIGDLTINVDIPRPGATNGFAEVIFSNGNKQTIRFDN